MLPFGCIQVTHRRFLSPSLFLSLPLYLSRFSLRFRTQASDLSRVEATEEEKIRAMMTQSTQDYDPSKYVDDTTPFVSFAMTIFSVPVY